MYVSPFKLGKNGRRGKDSETMKGDGARRRKTPSEDEEDLHLKRFKGAGDSDTDAQNSGDSSKVAVEGMGMWAGDSRERIGSMAKNGNSTDGVSPHLRALPPTPNSNPQMDPANAAAPRYPAQVKENGRLPSNQGAADSTSITSLTPNPPPLKPAPSPFSAASFPSVGQMPILVPGAPAPKPSTSPQPDREESCQSAYSKTAALVSPGPVTISWSQDSSPNVALSASVGFGPKAPTWGSQTEVRQSVLSLN